MFYLPMPSMCPKCISLRDDNMFARKGKVINDPPTLEEEKEYEMFSFVKLLDHWVHTDTINQKKL